MSAPERIWVDIADEYTRGAMIGNVYATDIGDEPYIRLDLHEAAVAAARAEGMTPDQRRHLPDLVALAMVGFSLLKSDGGASEWTHPAIAAFRAEVEPVLNDRRAAAMELSARKWGRS